jgi:hypothetical protein
MTDWIMQYQDYLGLHEQCFTVLVLNMLALYENVVTIDLG